MFKMSHIGFVLMAIAILITAHLSPYVAHEVANTIVVPHDYPNGSTGPVPIAIL